MAEIYVLGLGYGMHDSSVCLMRDGEIVAAIARERLSRIKHDGGYIPSTASTLGTNFDLSDCVDYCLDAGGISLDRVDLFVENNLINYAFDAWHQDEVKRFRRPYPKDKTVMLSHHLAHAYSAYYASGFANALVMITDGFGNELNAITTYKGEDAAHLLAHPELYRGVKPSTCEKMSFYSVNDGVFEVVRKDFTTGSLGLAYRAVTNWIFDPTAHEAGKTMGLAPCGNPEAFDFKLVESHEGVLSFPYLTLLAELEPPPQIKKWPEDLSSWNAGQRFFADIAARVQKDVEVALVDVATHARKKWGHRHLAISGGVGLNSVANKKILDAAGFDDVFIIPAAGDDGIAIGCAYWGTHHGQPGRRPGAAKQRPRFVSAAVGRSYPAATIDAAANTPDPRLKAQRLTEKELLGRTVEAIAAGKIVGWFQGRSEIGPRALGQRSILADARHPDMKAILNRRVKFREPFRPFAPVVTLERVTDYFDLKVPSPYMLLIADVVADKRSLLPSITHVDGTGRVQTVTEQDNGLFYRLVKAFGDKTGVPVIINTSFNIRGEPIVESPDQAIECFLCTDIDHLVLEDHWIDRVPMDDAALLKAVPRVNPRIRLSAERRFDGDTWELIRAGAFFQENIEHRFEMTPAFFEVLLEIDQKRTVSQLADALVDTTGAPLEQAQKFTVAAIRDSLAKNLLRLY